MRKPPAGVDLLCDTRLLKLGRVLAVGDALIHAEGDPRPVARASMTYSIPPEG
jgi:acyl-coenzyme A thioesterase PaaI-like protein